MKPSPVTNCVPEQSASPLGLLQKMEIRIASNSYWIVGKLKKLVHKKHLHTEQALGRWQRGRCCCCCFSNAIATRWLNNPQLPLMGEVRRPHPASKAALSKSRSSASMRVGARGRLVCTLALSVHLPHTRPHRTPQGTQNCQREPPTGSTEPAP